LEIEAGDRARRPVAIAGLVAIALLTGCGGDDDGGGGGATQATGPTQTTGPTASSPSATAPPADTAPPGGAEQEGGGQEPVRVPATFTLRGGRLFPTTVSAPAFLAVEVTVRSRDPVARVVTVNADRPYRLTVPPSRTARLTVPGQRPGTYPVTVRGGGRAALVWGGEPGP
jgi:hypothetical protein